MFVLISIGILSFVTGLVLCGLSFIGLRRFRVVDVPNERSSHVQIRVRGGGVGIIVTVCITVIGAGIAYGFSHEALILVPTSILAFVSFVDDIKSLSWKLRLFVQLASALGVLGILSWPPLLLGVEGLPALGWGLSTALWLFWLVGYTNAFNFMDGIDGLACFQCLISCIGTILLGDAAGISNTHWSMILATTLAGAALGFLPFNFPRSKMFMGDVGSAPIGLLLAIIGVDLSSQVQGVMLLSIFLLHANFILDTSINLIRRMLRGEKWHEAHRSHFYQKLQKSKRSHVFVTLFEVVIQLVTLILAILLLKTNSIWSLVFFAVGIALWLGFFVYCERSLPNSVGKVNRLQKS